LDDLTSLKDGSTREAGLLFGFLLNGHMAITSGGFPFVENLLYQSRLQIRGRRRGSIHALGRIKNREIYIGLDLPQSLSELLQGQTL